VTWQVGSGSEQINLEPSVFNPNLVLELAINAMFLGWQASVCSGQCHGGSLQRCPIQGLGGQFPGKNKTGLRSHTVIIGLQIRLNMQNARVNGVDAFPRFLKVFVIF